MRRTASVFGSLRRYSDNTLRNAYFVTGLPLICLRIYRIKKFNKGVADFSPLVTTPCSFRSVFLRNTDYVHAHQKEFGTD